jgi:hypothetical protein
MPMIWMIVTFNQTKQNHSMTLKCIVKHLIGFPHFALSYGPMYEPNKLIAFSNVDLMIAPLALGYILYVLSKWNANMLG